MYYKVTATTLFGKSVTFFMPYNSSSNIYNGAAAEKANALLDALPGYETEDTIDKFSIVVVGR